MPKLNWMVLMTIGSLTLLAGCAQPTVPARTQATSTVTAPELVVPAPTPAPAQAPAPTSAPAPDPATPSKTGAPAGTKPAAPKPKPRTGEVVSDPKSITVLVNKHYMLPEGYRPPDLVEPNVPFIFSEHVEKRLMRQEAAHALEQMFAAAKKDGVALAGVSGFRSEETQTGLFNYYVQTQGEETAMRYSAEPGHSEHQTGLAMDVSGSAGQCAADDCFAGTPEANWLAKHAPEYGFIIRYPKGKESVTGYAYEPWHVRYVGTALSKQIAAKALTLEEFLGKTQ